MKETPALTIARVQRALIACSAWCLLPVVEVSLRLLGFRKTRRWLGLARNDAQGSRARPSELAHPVSRSFVRALGFTPLKGGCLSRSMTLQWLLRRFGVSAILVFGVHGVASGIRAHAWVEVDGTVVGALGNEIGPYQALHAAKSGATAGS